ncbi:MAG TPA: transporter substrate-binding domain-containing protein [Burkholderiales bacterium]|nr:transporter substrate-binding domain-containing protein [Burkholderiales bacterium]
MKKLLMSACVGLLTIGSMATWAQGTSDPDEIADVLERSKARGKLVACADPYDYPYSSQNTNPPGFDVEIMQEIARRGGMRLEMYWADTGTRGGTSRAFRNSIMRGRCDVFMGISDSGDDDQLMGKLTFTKPYLGLGYVLVVQGRAADKRSLQELKDANIKVGVSMSTPIDDYLFTHNIPRGLYLDNRRIMKAMAEGEVDAALVWATAVAVAKREFPDGRFGMVDGYVPPEGQRWNLKYVVRKQDESLIDFLNESISELLSNGRIKQIVESYGVPFYPPFSS